MMQYREPTQKNNPRLTRSRRPSHVGDDSINKRKSVHHSTRVTSTKRKSKKPVIAIVAGLALVFLFAIVAFPLANPSGNGAFDRHQKDHQDSVNSTQMLAASNEQKFEPRKQLDARGKKLCVEKTENTGWRDVTDGERKVYLTFDDGPSENTEKILKVLDEKGAKASFFVTGHTPEKFYLIKKEYESGHSVGMHTFSHNYAEIYSSVDAYVADFNKIADVIEQQIGFRPFLFRFPGGSSNEISAQYSSGVVSAIATKLLGEGYQYYDWNISSGDAGSDSMPVDEIVANSCQEGWTNIMLLMHDTDAKQTTTEALPKIIDFYKERGYEFCAIDRDSFAVHHKICN